ncbi:pectinesterase inhibitor 9 [Amborella trichopoda]|uniref:pectinesterase n=1 Tax=Amborella trichopoda TaxID=13333 RepID=W1NFC3_AMBTC|nr:pectinesterase inhibitor 9 [Amborella trichopoda]ERM94153.1 hypothetical protein AMTR_s00010p00166600 [Amborella trichopoda]|eukprot:XP_006826916.1 pectinesterase inhibitor 9 [Amborella trichopoda]
MASHLFLLSLSLSSLLVYSAIASDAPNDSALIFIKTACETTLYPDLCLSSLSGQVEYVTYSHKKLARAALMVSLSATKATAGFVAELIKTAKVSEEEQMALNDCVEALEDGEDKMNDSMKELQRIKTESFKWQMSNVQTWISAALTDENACSDGFEELDGEVKDVIAGKIGDLAQLTSNALSLVNHFSTATVGGEQH